MTYRVRLRERESRKKEKRRDIVERESKKDNQGGSPGLVVKGGDSRS